MFVLHDVILVCVVTGIILLLCLVQTNYKSKIIPVTTHTHTLILRHVTHANCYAVNVLYGRILISFSMQTRVYVVGNGHLRIGPTRMAINKPIMKKKICANES